METNLETYYKEEKILIDEIRQGKLNYLEAKIRCEKLWKLIPSDVHINPFTLTNLMEEKYNNSSKMKLNVNVKRVDLLMRN